MFKLLSISQIKLFIYDIPPSDVHLMASYYNYVFEHFRWSYVVLLNSTAMIFIDAYEVF